MSYDNRILLVRRYRFNGKAERVNMYLIEWKTAVSAFHFLSKNASTEYCAMFSPKDKRGVRRQLRRYVYRNAMWTAARHVKRVYPCSLGY